MEQLAVAPMRIVREDLRRAPQSVAAVDHNGEVLERFVARMCDIKAALRLVKKARRKARSVCEVRHR